MIELFKRLLNIQQKPIAPAVIPKTFTKILCDVRDCIDNENGICILKEIDIIKHGQVALCSEYNEEDNNAIMQELVKDTFIVTVTSQD